MSAATGSALRLPSMSPKLEWRSQKEPQELLLLLELLGCARSGTHSSARRHPVCRLEVRPGRARHPGLARAPQVRPERRVAKQGPGP